MKIPVECTYVCVWSIWKHAFVCAKRVFCDGHGFGALQKRVRRCGVAGHLVGGLW